MYLTTIPDELRAQGHVVGTSYIQNGHGQLVVVDDVAMSIPDAKAVAKKHSTVAEIAAARKAN
jgi:hypothetical protein